MHTGKLDKALGARRPAVCVTQGTTEYLKNLPDTVSSDHIYEVRDMFGGLDRTMLHFYQAVSNGIC